FFDIGGHSLKAMRMISRVYQQSGIRISLKDVFKAETIRNLARIMQDMDKETYQSIEPVPPQPDYAVSHVQKRLWILNQFEESASAYNVLNVFRIRGELRFNWLEQAFRHLLRRHEILRTTLTRNGDQLRQRILPVEAIPIDIRRIDCNGHKENDAAVFEHIGNELDTPFDFEKGPLWRIAVLELSPTQYLGILTLHHVITDRWSGGIIQDEMRGFYADIAAGEDITLPPLKVQYKDFAHWQNARLETNGPDKHKSYWLERFAGKIPVLDLPIDNPRPRTRSFKGRQVGRPSPQHLRKPLEAIAKSQACTPFTVLVSITIALLHRYTGQEDIVVGVPVAGREHGELENQLGCYVNTLAVRNEFSGLESFEQLLMEVNKNLLEGYSHQLYPFDLLVEQLAPDTDRSRSPLFDIMFNYEQRNGKFEIDEEDPLEQSRISANKFDLVFEFSDYNDYLWLNINYNTDIFHHERIQRMMDHFWALAEAIVNGLDQPIGQLDYLSEDEKHQLIHRFNPPPTDYPSTTAVPQLFAEIASAFPNRPAISMSGAILSYRDLDLASNQLGNHLLRQHAIQPGDRIGLLMDRSIDLIISLLAILKAGAAYLPIDPSYPQGRIDHMLEDSAAKLLISMPDHPCLDNSDHRSPVNHTTLLYQPRQWQHEPDTQPTNCPNQNDLAYVIYTSGSTGRPKGVMVEHRSLLNLCNWHRRTFAVTPESRASLYSAIGFDACTWEIWPYLLAGACLYPITEADKHRLSTLLAVININNITHSFLPTPICEQLLTGNHLLPQSWCLLTGGDRLHITSPLPITVYNNYGPTESTVVTTSARLDASTTDATIGTAIDNTRVYLLDANLQPVPIGIPGELYIGGAGIARGYFNNAELTAQRFLPDPFFPEDKMYRSGDWARWHSSGQLEFAGRKDRQIKIRGFRIELEEIEKVVAQQLPNTSQIKVLVTGEGSEARIACFYASAQPASRDPRDAVREFLPAYMVPNRFIRLDTFPLTVHGKIDEDALRQLETTTTAADTAQTADLTPDEQLLFTIWQKLLGRHSTDPQASFLDNGGNSLLAIKLLSEIETTFSKKLFIRDVYNYPTLQQLAAYIRKDPDKAISIALNARTSGKPIVWFLPPVIGIPTVYEHLGRKLEPVCHAIAFDLTAITDETENVSIESIASACVKNIVSGDNDEKIIRLVGYSMGAWVAYEIARQLERQGKHCLVVLIDKNPPPSRQNKNRLPSPAEISNTIDHEFAHWIQFFDIPAEMEKRKAAVHKHYLAMQAYAPAGTIKADILAIDAERPEKFRFLKSARTKTWAAFTSGTFTRASIECDHYNIIRRRELEDILTLSFK
ncbi:MAG TPA: amino acid adenylation domain-containing protein, partial [Puia sp.]|uniref:non-ribosomal peptide synthetase n=1 Tax=Puia sp. TaxID=2045100 RepID=UPI002C32C784